MGGGWLSSSMGAALAWVTANVASAHAIPVRLKKVGSGLDGLTLFIVFASLRAVPGLPRVDSVLPSMPILSKSRANS
ncbi:hypothetical protein D3C76_1369520 [compost metagenome]